ncbi:MAG: putative dihydroorotate dehydrogenase B (NAD(+)), electron transfer subunit [Candidatus Roizmanbacteria bacterium GW2011_GWC2_34_23]|uniref:Putative dihydroorotate dehydrogenase B (NAD(+)), electron transfer subunit n=1 Tax=Candidatus Roizmanbacteria bacterium GW2011_GWC2_34_23 TaxID=1618484 RepID=A0A0G0BCQ7_9BACT|nr:MAG: putative dihydroorotate dehydrogenase B (NAD(+)), electron transfer subunit [Candidatus Roizmanbacteria bacterium GW2011_GWC2_34_23]
MNNIYQTAKIKSVEIETPKVKNFILDSSIRAEPGQYVMIWLPGFNEKPFGIVKPSPLMLSIAKIGPTTEIIHKLKVGDKVTFRGPYGQSFKIKSGKILLIGGGYGVVPLYFLASSISPEKRKNITVVIGARTKKELPFVTKFKKLGCKVLVTTDDGSAGFKGFTTQLTEDLLNRKKFKAVYSCGPMIMMKKIAQLSHTKKIFCQVSLESFFKCGGFGICGECCVNGLIVCKEGPIFEGKVLL